MSNTVGTIDTATLLAQLPATLEIRKSAREGARYPLYLSLPWGPWHLNHPDAQETMLEHGHFKGAPGTEVAAIPAGETLPGSPPVEPVVESTQVDENPVKKRSLLDFGKDESLGL